MKKICFLLILVLMGCGSGNKKPGNDTTGNSSGKKNEAGKPLLNITILWDLSDRISPVINPAKPEHFQRDTAIIKSFAEIFIKDMEARGTFSAKSKIRVVFSPLPEDPNISELAQKLNVDLSNMDNNQKKVVYDNIANSFPENALKIYNTTIKNNKWDGSDIWRFFKNDVKDFCISKETNYRNILVILTDGYIYHKNSMDQIDNKFAYILPDLLKKYNLRNNQKWEQEIDSKKFGLISKRSDLQELEILVLEVTPSAEYKNDEDIIKKVLSDWFAEMNVKRFAIYNSDLPVNTRQRIIGFLGN